MLPLPRARNTLFLCGLISATSLLASGQSITNQGGEISLSDALAGDQSSPAVAISANGGFVVWQDSRIDGNGQGIGARRVDSSLSGVGNAFRVNQTWVGNQERPQVALLPNGGAVVVWQGGPKGFPEVFARFLPPAGALITPEVRVSSASSYVARRYLTNMMACVNNRLINRRFALTERVRLTRELNAQPAVAVLPDGTVVVAYHGARATLTNGLQLQSRVTLLGGRVYTNDVLRPWALSGSWMEDVFLQRLSPTGAKLGGEVVVNQFSNFNQRNPAVAVLAGGNLVLTWISEERVNLLDADTWANGRPLWQTRVDVMARLFSAAGEPLGDEFTVNTASNLCANPSVAALPGGGFVVAWSQYAGGRPDSWDVWARPFSPDGTTTSDALPINTYTYGDQFNPRLAALGTNQCAVWTSLGQDGSWEGVYARLLVGGIPFSDEFRVNTTTVSKQIHPSVASDGATRFLVAWAGITAGSAFDVFAQRYLTTQPAALSPLLAGGPASGAAGGGLVAAGGSPLLPAGSAVAGQGTGSSVGSGSAIRVGIALNRHDRVLRWNARPGALYQVQISTNLSTWTNLGEPRRAAAASEALALTGDQTMAFFRVLEMQ